MSNSVSASKVLNIVRWAVSDLANDGAHHDLADALADIVATRLRKADKRYAAMSAVDLDALLLDDIRADAAHELRDAIAAMGREIKYEIEGEIEILAEEQAP